MVTGEDALHHPMVVCFFQLKRYSQKFSICLLNIHRDAYTFVARIADFAGGILSKIFSAQCYQLITTTLLCLI